MATAGSPWWPANRLGSFIERVLSLSPSGVSTGWEDVLIAEGMEHYAAACGDARAAEWVSAWATHHLGVPAGEGPPIPSAAFGAEEPVRGLRLGDYCGNWGAPLVLAPFAARTRDFRAIEAARGVAAFIIEKSLRGPDGVILHGAGRRAVWVDTLYYTAAPLAVTHAATGELRYAEEALRQCRLHARHLRDERSGCFRHDAEPGSGSRSAGLWARGNGWAVMALAETLACCPPELDGYSETLETYRSLCEGLLRLRHPSGLWRIVPDDPDAHLETSGTAMILLGLLEGVARGWLEESLLAPIAASYEALLASLVPDGRDAGALRGSQRPAGQGGWERHRVAELGECAYATGCLLKLIARLARAGLVSAPAHHEAREVEL